MISRFHGGWGAKKWAWFSKHDLYPILTDWDFETSDTSDIKDRGPQLVTIGGVRGLVQYSRT